MARALGVPGPALLQALPRWAAIVAAWPPTFEALVRAALRPGR